MSHSSTSTPKKRIVLLGATGSIGESTLRVLDAQSDAFELVAISGHHNHEKLAQIARKYNVKAVAITGKAPSDFHTQLPRGCVLYTGDKAACSLLEHEADIVVAAIMGAAGLLPVMRALELGRTVALANKEALVCAGSFVKAAEQNYGGRLLPVDSEHNAIFQALQGARSFDVDHISLTASGGPFLRMPLKALREVTPEQAVAHPKWSMGAKISVDSSTMMNKGLELIEAHWLFDMPNEKMEVVIHPEAIVHGWIQYKDGAVLAQLCAPDMAIPIGYCLNYPSRNLYPTPRLNLAQLGVLHFYEVEHDRFPALRLARAVMQSSAAASVAFNAANEVAVHAFLRRAIGYLDIVAHVESAVEQYATHTIHTIEDVLALDSQVRLNSEQTLLKAA